MEVPTSSGKRLAPEQTTTVEKKRRVEKLSPSMMYGNKIIWSDTRKDWHKDVSAVIIEEDDNTFSFRTIELGTLPLICAPFSANPSIFVSSSKEVPTTYSSSINMDQARVLTSFVSLLNASGKCLTVTQKVREASSGVSDSDDEQVPDPPISPAFTNSELLAVQIYYKKLWNAFGSAVAHQFTNAAGKMFFYHLAEFILILRPNTQYMPYISTNPHGNCQPGSANITHTIPRPHTRQSEVSSTTTSSSTEKVSDFVVFDHSAKIYTIVGEINDEAEQQNIEQMLGVWRKHQRAMLGFTCNKAFVLPRVLMVDNNSLVLYSFPELPLSENNLSDSLRMLAELFLAFTSFVDTC